MKTPEYYEGMDIPVDHLCCGEWHDDHLQVCPVCGKNLTDTYWETLKQRSSEFVTDLCAENKVTAETMFSISAADLIAVAEKATSGDIRRTAFIFSLMAKACVKE